MKLPECVGLGRLEQNETFHILRHRRKKRALIKGSVYAVCIFKCVTRSTRKYLSSRLTLQDHRADILFIFRHMKEDLIPV